MIPRRYVIAGLGIGLAIAPGGDPPPESLRRRKPRGRACGERLHGDSAEPGARVRGARSKRAVAAPPKRRKRPRSRKSASRHSPRPGPRATSAGRSPRRRPRSRLGRVAGDELDLGRLGARRGHRSEGAVHLPPHHPLRDAEDCGTHCPSPFHALMISTDNGATWGDQVPLCECLRSKAQYDPTIEVVPNTGAVYAAFLNADRHNGFSTVFMKSTDHGETWTEPVHVYGNVSWTDKPEITTSASGKDVYVSWNGPQGGDLYVGSLARLRQDVDAAEARRRQALLLRLRRPRARRRDGGLLGEQHPRTPA